MYSEEFSESSERMHISFKILSDSKVWTLSSINDRPVNLAFELRTELLLRFVWEPLSDGSSLPSGGKRVPS